METIRNYLESMFRNMPNTPEVRRAKDELWQMMEDKYSELTAEGRTENEAVGTVIAEFGNLDELSELLGISRFIPVQQEYEKAEAPSLVLEEVKDYLRDDRKAGTLLALGIGVCIVSVASPVFFSAFSYALGYVSLIEAIGVCGMFVLVAGGVTLMILSGNIRKKWKYIKRERGGIDYETAAYLEELIVNEKPKLSLLRWAGIMLCILSILPTILFSSIGWISGFFDDIGVVIMFIMVAIGVMLIVFSANYLSAAKNLLRRNSADTMGGHFTEMQAVERSREKHTGIMSVYWPTVTCLYLCISFLSFRWGITWLIWPVAGVVAKVIEMNQNRPSGM